MRFELVARLSGGGNAFETAEQLDIDAPAPKVSALLVPVLVPCTR